MMKMLTIFTLLFTAGKVSAGEMTVVDVRRNITLSEDDPVYKDFYINADASSGLKKNLVITAVRKINIRDASGANAVGEILVPVGQLKVIAIYDRVAVAREFTLLSRDELPMLEQTGIMSGDRIDLKGSFIDNSKPKPKRKIAATEPTPAAPAAALPIVPEIVAVTVTTPAPAPAPATASAASPVVSVPKGESLEKTADSGNNTLHE